VLQILRLADNPSLDKEVFAGHIKRRLRARMNAIIKEMSKSVLGRNQKPGKCSPHAAEPACRMW
jgi:hypothetical protein